MSDLKEIQYIASTKEYADAIAHHPDRDDLIRQLFKDDLSTETRVFVGYDAGRGRLVGESWIIPALPEAS